MTLDKDFVLTALLQHSFFPTQKEDREELPPIFTSAGFTPASAMKIVAGKPRRADGYDGFDEVSYKATRFNGVSRILSIPHPTAYAGMCLCIHEHWDKLDYIATNGMSMTRPRKHSDGRLFIMDYESSLEKRRRGLENSFTRRFQVHTDITNFFPSVYSHALAWATVGFLYAKSHKPPQYRNEWFNQLDEKLRRMKRNETHGIAIGPGTSSIVSEAILARVDEVLGKKYMYVRVVDDYTAYCSKEEDAQNFVMDLAKELEKYKLLLSIGKTTIKPLPQAMRPAWITELALALPRCGDVSPHDALNYLDFALDIAKAEPDGSVLKYALKSLLGQKLSEETKLVILRHSLTLSFYQPALLPVLRPLFSMTRRAGDFPYSKELQAIAHENARYRRSDAMAWSIFYVNSFRVEISKEIADEVIASRDCIPLLLLFLSGDAAHQARVLEFVKSLDVSNLYELDEYWLLIYELFLAGKISNLYKDEDAFDIMKESIGSFIAAGKA